MHGDLKTSKDRLSKSHKAKGIFGKRDKVEKIQRRETLTQALNNKKK